MAEECMFAMFYTQNHGEPWLNEPMCECIVEDYLAENDEECGPECSQYLCCSKCDVEDDNCECEMDGACWKSRQIIKALKERPNNNRVHTTVACDAGN